MAQDEIEAILDQIRDRGGRVTSLTRRIVQIGVENPYAHLRGIDFVDRANAAEPTTESTVYRILDRLVDYGILERSQLGTGPPRFHLNPFNHEHVTCQKCGSITDVPASLLDDIARKLRADYDFVLQKGLSSLNGVCGQCRDAG